MEIALYTLRTVAEAIVEPSAAFILILIALIFYNKNKKIAAMQKMIIGESLSSPFELTISQIVIGIIAGTLASLIFTFLGLVFDKNSSIYLLFIISLFFMAFKPRFICFSYSGAVLGIVSLILGFVAKTLDKPQINFLNIDILTLMTLVGVLHVIEGILVMVDGTKGSIPVFTNRDGKIVGGFALKRYWALPVAILIFSSVNDSTLALGNKIMAPQMIPQWWPLIKENFIGGIIKNSIITSMAIYGVIGYSSITFTKSKKKKTLTSGILIMAYGILVTVISQLAAFGVVFQLGILFFVPIVHECMLRIEKHIEMVGKPKFISSEEGIMVLEVAPKSPAFQIGIRSGDLLTEINDKKIETGEEIFTIIKETYGEISFKLKKPCGEVKKISYNNRNGKKRLGILIVPREVPDDSLIVKVDEEKFKDVLEKLKNKHKD